jgi:hypothetical protein
VALITILISETEVHNNQDLAFLGSDIPIVWSSTGINEACNAILTQLYL